MKYTSSRDAGLNECTDAGSDHKLLFDYFLMQLSWSDLILSLHSCSFFSWSSGCNFFIDLLQDWLLSHLELKLVILLAAVKKRKKNKHKKTGIISDTSCHAPKNQRLWNWAQSGYFSLKTKGRDYDLISGVTKNLARDWILCAFYYTLWRELRLVIAEIDVGPQAISMSTPSQLSTDRHIQINSPTNEWS